MARSIKSLNCYILLGDRLSISITGKGHGIAVSLLERTNFSREEIIPHPGKLNSTESFCRYQWGHYRQFEYKLVEFRLGY